MVKLKRDKKTGLVMAWRGNKQIGAVYTMGDYIEQSEDYEKREENLGGDDGGKHSRV